MIQNQFRQETYTVREQKRDSRAKSGKAIVAVAQNEPHIMVLRHVQRLKRNQRKKINPESMGID
jgi:hypothetical protein